LHAENLRAKKKKHKMFFSARAKGCEEEGKDVPQIFIYFDLIDSTL